MEPGVRTFIFNYPDYVRLCSLLERLIIRYLFRNLLK